MQRQQTCTPAAARTHQRSAKKHRTVDAPRFLEEQIERSDSGASMINGRVHEF
jgi:hypothetical protein